MIRSEVEDKADFTIVRYAQVWEDADTLLQGLDIQPDDVCLSIASAGDNALAMLTRNPARVIALDLNPAQLYCLELRVAAYRTLEHGELLKLMGSRPCADRLAYYERCKPLLGEEAGRFWDGKQSEIAKYGVGGVGKFESYFRMFKNWILPLTHSKRLVTQLLSPKSRQDRERFFDQHWNTWRWRMLIRLFFSQKLMGLLGRDPAFFAYVQGSFSDHVFGKIRHGMRTLNPAENPYLSWILLGTHGKALPFALREENFESIKCNLDKLEWHLLSTESFAESCKESGTRISRFNLSNIFEYMSQENYAASLATLVEISEPGARMLYWNMMVPRSCPPSLAHKLQPHTDLAQELLARDKAIFYSNLVIEEVR